MKIHRPEGSHGTPGLFLAFKCVLPRVLTLTSHIRVQSVCMSQLCHVTSRSHISQAFSHTGGCCFQTTSGCGWLCLGSVCLLMDPRVKKQPLGGEAGGMTEGRTSPRPGRNLRCPLRVLFVMPPTTSASRTLGQGGKCLRCAAPCAPRDAEQGCMILPQWRGVSSNCEQKCQSTSRTRHRMTGKC